jgi:hypothetical protein
MLDNILLLLLSSKGILDFPFHYFLSMYTYCKTMHLSFGILSETLASFVLLSCFSNTYILKELIYSLKKHDNKNYLQVLNLFMNALLCD